MARRMSRRQVIKSTAAAGLASAAADALGQPATSPATVTAPTTSPATSAPADPITPADVAAADKIAGRDYPTDAERSLMLGNLETYRKRLRTYRNTAIEVAVEPAVRFDPRLPGTPLPGGPSACTLSDGPFPPFDGDVEALAFCSAADLSRLLRARRLTSLQLTRMYLDRLKRYGPRLLCVVNLTEARALAAAERADAELAAGTYRSPLHGVPYGLKDLLATRGTPTTWGVSPYQNRVFDFDATVVERLDAAGAVLLAKLSLGELAMGDVWFGGRTRNPWKPERGSSGSSAGPGAATAAGLVGFSIGSETLGSIISPSVENGTVGLRPTWGRVSRHGAMPLTWTMDKIGPMCRGVEDCALVLAAIAGADPRDPTAADVPLRWDPTLNPKSLRIGYNPAAFDFADKGWQDESVKAVYREALDAIRSLAGRDLVPVNLPPAERYGGLASTLIAVESASSMAELLTSGQVRELVQQEAGSWPNTFRVGATVPAADYLRAQRLRTLLMREMAEALEHVDLYVTRPYAGPSLAFTNLTGHPALISRCGFADGRPRMIEFVGQLYREDAICAIGHAYERATGWHTRWPDVTALPETPT